MGAALLAFVAGIDAHVVNIARNIMLASALNDELLFHLSQRLSGSTDELGMIAENCVANLSQHLNTLTIKASDVRAFVAKSVAIKFISKIFWFIFSVPPDVWSTSRLWNGCSTRAPQSTHVSKYD